MPIIYHPESKTFHLQNKEISYIFYVLKNNELGQLYFGKKITDRSDFSHFFQLESRALAPSPFRGDLAFSLEVIKQEYPSYGRGDYRDPAYHLTTAAGDSISQFEYKSHLIYTGKKELEGLPATFGSQEEITTLEILLHDSLLNANLYLYYHLFENLAVITRSVKMEALGSGFYLNRLMSLSLDLYDSDFTMLQLDGAWSRERHLHSRKLISGIQSISSTRGASSASHNPFIALKRPQTNQHQGEVFGFSLIYSGNFLAQVEVDNYNVSRLLMGINPFEFGYALDVGQSFQSPEAIMVYSDQGINAMSQTFHQLFRKHLMPQKWAKRERPLLVNNWEATYFDFNHDKIIQIAREAKELGLELFVLDDGWFGQRNDDTTSLGDWFVNKDKLPSGLEGLAQEIKALGLQFGLWFEPEMINEVSELYNEHPDWVIQVPHRRKSYGRNQWVLDLSRSEVVDALFEMMRSILASGLIDYVKWDMNRNITEAFSVHLPAYKQKEFFHRYILGVYALYERLTSAFPAILFESCASGGARFDPGMLYYAPQTWTSDDMDPVERLKIQYGTSLLYPLISMGSHVPTSPNHQVHRHTTLTMRANVAYFGTFGYELDLSALSDAEKQEVKEQVVFFKKWRKVVQFGKFYRLSEYGGNHYYWMVVSEDQSEAIIGAYTILATPMSPLTKCKLAGLHPDYQYSCEESGMNYSGDELMHAGIFFQNNRKEDLGDFTSRIYTLKRI